MKVIFLKDVPRVGQKYEVKDVADGYANNFLLPKKLAEMATAKTVTRIEMLKGADEVERKVREDLLMKNVGGLDGMTVTLKEKANEKGHLFAGIHNAELVKALKEQTRLELPPEALVLPQPIRETGEFDISVVIQGRKGVFKLLVERAQ